MAALPNTISQRSASYSHERNVSHTHHGTSISPWYQFQFIANSIKGGLQEEASALHRQKQMETDLQGCCTMVQREDGTFNNEHDCVIM